MNIKGRPESRGSKGYVAEVGTSMGDQHLKRICPTVVGEIINDIFTSFEYDG
jgi:hypothetical protein